MNHILITTDFSEASRHALDFTCLQLRDKNIALELLHIYGVPVTYTTDGVALAAIGEAIDRAERQLDLEIEHAREQCPGLEISGRVVTGGFLETLRDEVSSRCPLFLVLGTAGFNDFFLGDDDPLNALRSLAAPVLFVPRHAELRPIRNTAYACNYAYAGPQTPVQAIIDWVQLIGTELQVVHMDPKPFGADDKQVIGQQWLQEQLAPLHPQFHWIQDEDVLHGLFQLGMALHVDCLLVVPRKYGFWENLFHQSRTKALARFNKVPIMAFHPKE